MSKAAIIQALRSGDIEPAIEDIFTDSMGGKNPVYVAKVGDDTLKMINSSNQQPIDNFDRILEDIAERVEEDEFEGEVGDYSSWNYVAFEILEEGNKGTLCSK